MADGIREYSSSCDFIIDTFKLNKDTNHYTMTNVIVEEYKLLQDKLLVAESVKTEVPNLKQEKKRGRPKKLS